MRLLILVLSAACVIFYGYALAGYGGNFFGRGRLDYVLWGLAVGTACGAAAICLWKKWMKNTAPDLLIFDVDGVLIDANESYRLATVETVQWCWENILGGTADCEGYTQEYLTIAKMHPAFNDDAAIAWVILGIMRQSGHKNMKDAFPSMEVFKTEIDKFPYSGQAIEDASRENPQSPTLDELRAIFQEIYFGTELYEKFNGTSLKFGKEGLWQGDLPNISKNWRDIGLPVGIYTGRGYDEMHLGFKVLNWPDFPKDMLVCYDDGILKPSPEGLKVLCERAGAKQPVYFGDTASDLGTWRAFGKGMFVAIGPVLKPEARRGEFLHFDTLEEALASLGL